MNYHKYNQLIAEHCGWTQIKPTGRLDGQLVGYPPQPILGEFEEIPDYWNDLNAIHEAEKKLIFSRRTAFVGWLGEVIGRDVNATAAPSSCVYATAPQRAEAFLKTVGKWEE